MGRITARKAPGNGAKLQALRKRAGFTQEEVSSWFGYSNASGWQRWETGDGADNLLPADMTKVLIERFVGHGKPPISREDVLSVSSLRLSPQATVAPPVARAQVVSAMEPTVAVGTVAVPMRYRISRGVFYDLEQTRLFSLAPFVTLPRIPAVHQWAVLIEDDSASAFGLQPGAYLHCVDVSHYPAPEGAIVVASRSVGGSSSEVFVAVVRGGKLWRGNDAGEIEGHVLGPALFEYSPVQ